MALRTEIRKLKQKEEELQALGVQSDISQKVAALETKLDSLTSMSSKLQKAEAALKKAGDRVQQARAVLAQARSDEEAALVELKEADEKVRTLMAEAAQVSMQPPSTSLQTNPGRVIMDLLQVLRELQPTLSAEQVGRINAAVSPGQHFATAAGSPGGPSVVPPSSASATSGAEQAGRLQAAEPDPHIPVPTVIGESSQPDSQMMDATPQLSSADDRAQRARQRKAQASEGVQPQSENSDQRLRSRSPLRQGEV